MALVLYHHEAGSTSSQKVRLCLNYKRLDFESVNIDLNKHQNQSNEYLSINRHGLIPTLVHNENVVRESNLINEYLDRVFRDKPLLPQDPLLVHKVQYLCKRQEYINEQCFRYLSYQYSGRVNTLTDEEIQNHPQLDRRRFLRNLKQGLCDDAVNEIESYLISELKYLDEMLASSDWFCGKIYTLADISWTAAIFRLEQLGKLNFLNENKLRHLLDWYNRVKGMENFCTYDF